MNEKPEIIGEGGIYATLSYIQSPKERKGTKSGDL